jgi:chromosome segregation ATPase
MTAGKVSRIAKLEDEIKQRDRRIAELRAEIDELGDLVERMEENVEDANTVIERSREWLDDPFWDWTALEDYRAKYNALVRDWNAVVPLMRQQPSAVRSPPVMSKSSLCSSCAGRECHCAPSLRKRA